MTTQLSPYLKFLFFDPDVSKDEGLYQYLQSDALNKSPRSRKENLAMSQKTIRNIENLRVLVLVSKSMHLSLQCPLNKLHWKLEVCCTISLKFLDDYYTTRRAWDARDVHLQRTNSLLKDARSLNNKGFEIVMWENPSTEYAYCEKGETHTIFTAYKYYIYGGL